MDTHKTVYFITGASGVGKTTLVNDLQVKYRARTSWSFLHFDSIGVPSLSEMKDQYGSPSAWQEAKTFEWIERIVHKDAVEKAFLEGQVNLQFIRSGFAKIGFTSYQIILLDCDPPTMAARLILGRSQPELFNVDMIKWLEFLKHQAEQLGVVAINSSKLSRDQVVQRFEDIIGL